MVVNAALQGRRTSRICRPTSTTAARSSRLFDRALLALQGPRAGAVLRRIAPDSAGDDVHDRRGRSTSTACTCFVTRSGYTGEDGFEISVPGGDADDLARKLLGEPEVKPIGLGARDSLRLEAGLCLYGHDIDRDDDAGRGRPHLGDREAPARARAASPAPAIISGSWPKARRASASASCPRARRRRAPIPRSPTSMARSIGEITSRRLRPHRRRAGRHGLCRADLASAGTPLQLIVRGKALPAQVAAMPFVAAPLSPLD